MEQTETSEKNAESLNRVEGEPEAKPAPVLKRRAWPIVLTAGILLAVAGGGIGAIWYFSAAFTDITARTTFIIGSAINLFIFLAIVAQACIYWGQRSIMEKQWQVMEDSLVETRKLFAVGEYQAEIAALGGKVSERNAIATEVSAKAAEQAVEIATDNMIHAQRAYVMFDSASVDYRDDTHLAVTFSITNFGNTPALNFRPFTRVELRTTEPEINEEDVEWEGPGGIIPPHYPVETVRNLTITFEERKQMGPGEPLRLHLWGMVKYDDIFGKEHLTKFCAVHNIGTGPRFGQCETGNEAT